MAPRRGPRAAGALSACAIDAVAVCDEVWEHVIFDGAAHLPLMAEPGMRERCVKIGSAGKIFSLTGWKVGFVMRRAGAPRVLAKAHQFLTFTTPPNLQAAVAYGLGKDDAYFRSMRARPRSARATASSPASRRRALRCCRARATYFVNVDLAAAAIEEDDAAFCRRLVSEHGVAAIPVSAFYAEDPVTILVRFCFAKPDETLDAALERLSAVRHARAQPRSRSPGATGTPA